MRHMPSADPDSYDLIIIGGGPAGLQAALSAGRVRRTTLLLDSGDYRNAPAGHMHNVLGHDGVPPADLRRAAHEELSRYPSVEVRSVMATQIDEDGRDDVPVFDVVLHGGEGVTGRAVVLATGVRDVLPEIDGLADAWGQRVAHCPYCHGYELADGRLAVLGAALGARLTPILEPLATEVIVVGGPGEDLQEVLDEGDHLLLRLADGTVERVNGLFVRPPQVQAAPFARSLGLLMSDDGVHVRVDDRCRTSRAGIYAAGDMAVTGDATVPPGVVPHALATGSMAAVTAIADLG